MRERRNPDIATKSDSGKRRLSSVQSHVPPQDKTYTSSFGGPYSVMGAVSADTLDATERVPPQPPMGSRTTQSAIPKSLNSSIPKSLNLPRCFDCGVPKNPLFHDVTELEFPRFRRSRVSYVQSCLEIRAKRETVKSFCEKYEDDS